MTATGTRTPATPAGGVPDAATHAAPSGTGPRSDSGKGPRDRGLRLRSAFSEAGRNLVSGTTRAVLLAVAFLLTVGTVAALDVRAVSDVTRTAQDFRAHGGSVQVLTATGSVDPRRCAALAGLPGIEASGAIRAGRPLVASALPASTLTQWDVTPGFLAVLDSTGASTGARQVAPTATGAGVWLSADLAETLALRPGATLATRAGDATVGGTYVWADDGRDRALGYSVLTPTAATGAYDACWAQIWPVDDNTTGLLYTALDPGTNDATTTLGQLNQTQGTSYDARAALQDRPTRHAPLAAAVLGLVLGLVAVRTRRLELAAALHARIPRPALTLQVLVETACWVLAAAAIAAAALAWPAIAGSPDASGAAYQIGLRIVVAGVAGVLVGVVVATAMTREKHLFRYFKER